MVDIDHSDSTLSLQESGSLPDGYREEKERVLRPIHDAISDGLLVEKTKLFNHKNHFYYSKAGLLTVTINKRAYENVRYIRIDLPCGAVNLFTWGDERLDTLLPCEIQSMSISAAGHSGEIEE